MRKDGKIIKLISFLLVGILLLPIQLLSRLKIIQYKKGY